MTPLCRLTTFIFFSKIGLFASKEQWANGTGVCPSYGLHTDYRRTRPLTTCSYNRAGSRRIVLPAQCRSWITKNTRFVIVLSIYFVQICFLCVRVRRAFETYLFQEIYEQIDKNNDGTIVFEEFVTVLDHPKVNLSRWGLIFGIRSFFGTFISVIHPKIVGNKMGHLAKRIIGNDGHSLLSVEYCNGIIDNDGHSSLNIAILKPFWAILVNLSRCKDYYILL